MKAGPEKALTADRPAQAERPVRALARVANAPAVHCFYPPQRHGPEPNEDLSEGVKADYEEARSILNLSPRGAAVLLRLCVEKLSIHLNAQGSTLDDKIAALVKKGLDDCVQQALDAVRVIGT